MTEETDAVLAEASPDEREAFRAALARWNALGTTLRLARGLLALAELQRRPGERHAAQMERWRLAGILDPWPKVLDGPLPRPLMIGINRALLARLDRERCTVRTLRRLVGRLVRSRLYLEALARPGATRHDLDGQPVEPVSDEHQAHAQELLKERRAKVKAGPSINSR